MPGRIIRSSLAFKCNSISFKTWSCRQNITSALTFLLCLLISVPAVLSHKGIDPEIQELSEKLEKDPDNIKLLLNRAWNYRMNKDFANSLADVDRAIELDPQNLEILLQRGLTLSGLGENVEAEAVLSRFLDEGAAPIPGELVDRIAGTTSAEISGKTSDRSLLQAALIERARVYDRMSQYHQAIDDYTTAIAMRPSTQLYLARGKIQELLGDNDQAAEGYLEGLARIGESPQLKKALMRVEIERERYDQVLRLIDQELAHPSGKTDWYLRRAEILDLMGKRTASLHAMEKALREANRALTKRTTALNRLSRAKVLMALGKRTQAKRDLELAVQMAPHMTQAKELLDVLKGQRP